MSLMAVDAAVGHEPEQVQRVAAVCHRIHGGDEHRVLEEFTLPDASIDARQVLVHDAPRPQIHMPDLRVAHLARGQPHPLARRLEGGVRKFRDELRVGRGAGQRDGVPFALVTQSPSVEHDEHERCASGHV